MARYMEICLHDPQAGYYATRPGLGVEGDFITAPLISQMFGEALGLWAAEIWNRVGSPPRVRLVELGPGDGTMMSDVLRAARVAPGFLDACDVWLIESSNPLRHRQYGALADHADVKWASDPAGLPRDAPLIILANEFLDCLPIRQAVRFRSGWRERLVGAAADGRLTFTMGDAVAPPAGAERAPIGAVAEWSDALADLGRVIGDLVVKTGGAALFIDYGRDHPGPGDTLQALRGHQKEGPLAHPGAADLTAHVDFPAFLEASRSTGAVTGPILTQGDFLAALGIGARAAALARSHPARAGTIERQLARLTAPEQMGTLFKAVVIHAPGLSAPGFQDRP